MAMAMANARAAVLTIRVVWASVLCCRPTSFLGLPRPISNPQTLINTVKRPRPEARPLRSRPRDERQLGLEGQDGQLSGEVQEHARRQGPGELRWESGSPRAHHTGAPRAGRCALELGADGTRNALQAHQLRSSACNAVPQARLLPPKNAALRRVTTS